jgi:hypothetical protein
MNAASQAPILRFFEHECRIFKMPAPLRRSGRKDGRCFAGKRREFDDAEETSRGEGLRGPCAAAEGMIGRKRNTKMASSHRADIAVEKAFISLFQ